MTSDVLEPRPAADPEASPTLPPLGPNPFVGPRPYQPGERLFGRRQETRELYYLLSAERIVWLHSPSGAGKTSLIQASLTPMLAHDGFAVCPPIRVNLDLPRLAESLPGANPYSMALMLSLEERLPSAERRPLADLAALGPVAYLQALAQSHQAAGKAGTVLVLDQFEEVLTLHPLDRAAKETFFQTLGEALRDPNLWALFALREEYLAALEPYVDWIPSRWSNTFRLDLLGRDAALEVLQRAAAQGGRRFSDEAAGQLFANLARTQVQQPDGSFREETGRYAEPVQLQVVCRRLWDAMPADDRSIDPEDLTQFGEVSQALGGYYAESIGRIVGGDQGLERRIRSWFGERLIAPGGVRGQVLRGRDSSEGLPNAVIDALLDTHLIRGEQRAGATRYELAHDRLVAPIQADNVAWLDAHLQPFQRQTALWVERGRPASGGDQLLRAGTLSAALDFQRAHPALISDDEERLIDISRSARRGRRWTWSLLGLLGALIFGFAVTAWWLMDRAQEKEREAWYQVAAGHRKDAVAAGAADPLQAGQHWANAAWRFDWAGRAAESANALLALKFINDRPRLSAVMGHGHEVNGAIYSADGKRILTWSKDSTARLWDSASGAALTPSLEHKGAVRGAQLSRDESRILTWSRDGTARLWDSASGVALNPPLKHEGPVSGAQFSRDDSRILTWSDDGTARLWDSASGAALTPSLEHKGAVRGAQLSRDDSRILTWSKDGTARLWDSASGAALTQPLKVSGAQFSREDSRILTWSEDGTARLWDSASGAALTPPLKLKHEGPVRGAQFSRDESRILTWSDDGTARLWDSASGAALTPPLKHEGLVDGAQFTRDESRILTWSRDILGLGTARLWDSASGAALTPPLEHKRDVLGAQFSRDESRILTWSADGTARLWDSASGAALTPPLKHEDRVWGAQFSRDESRILTWSDDGTARLWDSASGAALTPPLKHAREVLGAQFSRDDSRILTWSKDGTARLWDSASGTALIPPLRHEGLAMFSRDGSRILIFSEDRTVRLWDSASGAALSPPYKHEDAVSGVELSRDGSRILTWSQDGTARLWDSASGAALTPPLKHDRAVEGAQFSRDESRILTWTTDTTLTGDILRREGTARLWDSASGAALTPSLKHEDAVRGAQFSRDDARILTWSDDGTAQLWDSASGAALTPPLKHKVAVVGAQFSRDDSRILTWSADRTARLWDSASGAALTPPLKHGETVLGAQFSRDNSRILTRSYDGTARLWDSASGAALTPPLKHDQAVAGAQFSRDESRILTWSQDGIARLWDSASGAPLSPPFAYEPMGDPRIRSMDAQETWLRTWTQKGGLRTWDLTIDMDWPIGQWPLRVEAETGTFLTPTGELQALSATDWTRKRFCEYDRIRHDLKRIPDAEWAESRRRCQALDDKPAAPQPPTEAPAAQPAAAVPDNGAADQGPPGPPAADR